MCEPYNQYLVKIPVAQNIPADKRREVEHLVTRMIGENQKLLTLHSPQEQTLIQKQIETLDREIDRLVYALYGLTQEEIALVEESVS